MKDFRKDFFYFYDKLKSGENFAFQRFSDGELRIMQGLELKLTSDQCQIGDYHEKSFYHPEDFKHVNPVDHFFVADKLIEAYVFKKQNYYKGISCRCCVGDKDFQQMIDWHGGGENLTWSNLWVNGNYRLFKEFIVSEFKNKKIVFILNKNASLKGLPFKVVKDFRVGDNCIVNDFDKHKEVARWIERKRIKNHVFLFSASSLSNIMIYELFKRYDNNTYIDIGTTLNMELGMKGIRKYHVGKNFKICIW
jgi:hypothetical protein